MKTKLMKIVLTLGIVFMFTTPSLAIDVHPAKEDVTTPKKEYSPYVNDHFPNNVYFGDTHLHPSQVVIIGYKDILSTLFKLCNMH